MKSLMIRKLKQKHLSECREFQIIQFHILLTIRSGMTILKLSGAVTSDLLDSIVIST